MEGPHRSLKERSSFKCPDAIISLSHQKILYPVPLWKPLETVLSEPGSLIASQATSTSTGPGPPNTCTEVANPDLYPDDSTKSSHVPSTIDGHTNNPGDQLGVETTSATSELQDSTIESSVDIDYTSDPDFQYGVQEVN